MIMLCVFPEGWYMPEAFRIQVYFKIRLFLYEPKGFLKWYQPQAGPNKTFLNGKGQISQGG